MFGVSYITDILYVYICSNTYVYMYMDILYIYGWCMPVILSICHCLVASAVTRFFHLVSFLRHHRGNGTSAGDCHHWDLSPLITVLKDVVKKNMEIWQISITVFDPVTQYCSLNPNDPFFLLAGWPMLKFHVIPSANQSSFAVHCTSAFLNE